MKTAILFTGQGSQWAGMATPLMSDPYFARTIEVTNETFPLRGGHSLAELATSATQEILDQTVLAQPVVFLLEMAVWNLLRHRPVWREIICPNLSFYAGHSLGEFPALVASGMMTFEDGLELVCRRGELMQAASEEGPGSMVALVGDSDIVLPPGIILANDNSPRQRVIAGKSADIERYVASLQGGGIRIVRLNVSGAFHTPLMSNAASLFAEEVSKITLINARFPWFSTSSCTVVQLASVARRELTQQMTTPVRFRESVKKMFRCHGIRRFIEIGPRRVLCRLVRETEPDADVHYVGPSSDIDETLSRLG